MRILVKWGHSNQDTDHNYRPNCTTMASVQHYPWNEDTPFNQGTFQWVSTIERFHCILYLAIVWGRGVAVNCRKIIRLLCSRPTVDAGDVEQLLPGPLHGLNWTGIAWTTPTNIYKSWRRNSTDSLQCILITALASTRKSSFKMLTNYTKVLLHQIPQV